MSGAIQGQVLNQRDGQVIEGATLQLQGEGVTKDTSSGNNGGFLFDDLAASKYEVTVNKEGFDPGIYGPLAVVDGEPTSIVVALQPNPL